MKSPNMVTEYVVTVTVKLATSTRQALDATVASIKSAVAGKGSVAVGTVATVTKKGRTDNT